MEIENLKATNLYKIQRISYAILLGGWVMLLFYLFPREEYVFGISKWYLVVIPLVGYIMFLVYYYLIDASYFFFKVDKGILIFRFYSMRLLGENRKSIEIASDSLLSIEIKRSFLNKKWILILHQRMGRKVAKYPPICISLLNRIQRDKLTHALNSIIISNRPLD